MTWTQQSAAGFNYWRTGGDHPPMLLAHGYGDNGLCWARVAKHLQANFDLVMMDARGHGTSARAQAAFAPAADLAALIDALALGAPAVIGHSVGASAAASLAASHPDLVSRLILEDPPWSPPLTDDETKARGADYRKRMQGVATFTDAELLALGSSLHPDWPTEEFPEWGRAKQQLQPDLFKYLELQDFHSSVPAIRCPTLIIHGEPQRGSMLRPDTAAEVLVLNPALTIQGITGAGHNIRREQPAACIAAITAFLNP